MERYERAQLGASKPSEQSSTCRSHGAILVSVGVVNKAHDDASLQFDLWQASKDTHAPPPTVGYRVHTHLVLLPTLCRYGTQNRGRVELESPLFFLPLDRRRFEHVTPSCIEVRGYDRAESMGSVRAKSGGEPGSVSEGDCSVAQRTCR